MVVRPIMAGLAELRRQQAVLDRELRRMAKADAVCRLLMRAPGVGPAVALAYRATLDEPGALPTANWLGLILG